LMYRSWKSVNRGDL